jgi:hypothetical protein
MKLRLFIKESLLVLLWKGPSLTKLIRDDMAQKIMDQTKREANTSEIIVWPVCSNNASLPDM